MNHYEKRKTDTVDFTLKILVSVEEEVFSNMQSLQQSLRSYLDPRMEYTIVIDDSRGLRNEKV